METNRAATDRARDKTKSLGMDWPHVEETRWTCSQEGTGVETTGGEKERKAPPHLGTSRMAELERKHVTWNEAKVTAQNRVRWRVLVEDLCFTGKEED